MAGAIIENMSTKKLCIVGGILLVFQVIAFLVGGLIGECRPSQLSPLPPPPPPARVVELLVTVSLTRSHELISPAIVVQQTRLPGPLCAPFAQKGQRKVFLGGGSFLLFFFFLCFGLCLRGRGANLQYGDWPRREGSPCELGACFFF